jgi:UDP-N-acetylmuramate dehydrogenase
MKSSKQFSLRKNNSFNVKSTSPIVYFPQTLSDLESLPNLSLNPFYILGEGSNTLFVDTQAPIIIKPDFKGIDISETDDNYFVRAGAGENWHNLVCLCINKGVYGLENLALIPGSIGASPVQNIGAYGVELSNFCVEVTWFDFSSRTVKTLDNQECCFSYRDSIFKNAFLNKGVITEVVLKLSKKWQANLSYSGLNELPSDANAKEVMDKVISLRQAKLPDPDQLPNAGSFFKNPVVSVEKLASLKTIYPEIPFYSQDNGNVKLAAGWLIEQTGLKGYLKNQVGVHENQALVLVNHESDYGKDILGLAQFVQQEVHKKFEILLSPEVRMITSQGERQFIDLPMVDWDK